jgi:hypothetical protein
MVQLPSSPSASFLSFLFSPCPLFLSPLFPLSLCVALIKLKAQSGSTLSYYINEKEKREREKRKKEKRERETLISIKIYGNSVPQFHAMSGGDVTLIFFSKLIITH